MRLDRNKFTDWLKSRPPTEIIGENRDCHCCPIARFYVEASGGCEVVIGERDGRLTIDRGYAERVLPRWAANFVFQIDGERHGKITAGRALEVMTAINERCVSRRPRR